LQSAGKINRLGLSGKKGSGRRRQFGRDALWTRSFLGLVSGRRGGDSAGAYEERRPYQPRRAPANDTERRHRFLAIIPRLP
jgi:hypothetical protein